MKIQTFDKYVKIVAESFVSNQIPDQSTLSQDILKIKERNIWGQLMDQYYEM